MPSLAVMYSYILYQHLFCRRDIILARKEEERRLKEQQIHDEVQRRIQAEEKKRLDAEKIISALEAEEKELIDRLKKTQEMQEKVWHILYTMV